jgi:hypothetical protein
VLGAEDKAVRGVVEARLVMRKDYAAAWSVFESFWSLGECSVNVFDIDRLVPN